ncbi:hypothetical protein N824_10285 [Pedobacter sp. V48]|nr:hypothetical protein N824_10285 [Pedobacter sp. V48]
MKKFFGIFFMYLLFSLNVSAQSLFEFKEDFEKLAVGKFADIGIDSLVKNITICFISLIKVQF